METQIKMMSLEQIEQRFSAMPTGSSLEALSDEQLNVLNMEARSLNERKTAIHESVEARNNLMQEVLNKGMVLEQGGKKMNTQIKNNDDLEVRSLQKFLTHSEMSVEERSVLTTVNSSAVIPKSISNELITNIKYSDLLHRATIFNERGKISVPLVQNVSGEWVAEGEEIVSTNGVLSAIELEGYTLARIMEISSATDSMATADFQSMLLDLISSELIETLEKSFLDGDGVNKPKGLSKMTFVADENLVEVTGELGASNIAKGLSLLAQRYARNSVILVNSKTLYNISLFKGTSEYAYDMSSSATLFMGKEILVNEHVEDDNLYILDPSQLFVKMSKPMEIEADKSSGFRKATILLRALMIVDFAFNPNAVVKVSVTA